MRTNAHEYTQNRTSQRGPNPSAIWLNLSRLCVIP